MCVFVQAYQDGREAEEGDKQQRRVPRALRNRRVDRRRARVNVAEAVVFRLGYPARDGRGDGGRAREAERDDGGALEHAKYGAREDDEDDCRHERQDCDQVQQAHVGRVAPEAEATHECGDRLDEVGEALGAGGFI